MVCDAVLLNTGRSIRHGQEVSGALLYVLNSVYVHINGSIADQAGVRLDIRFDGDWAVYTFRTEGKMLW
jgi:hypothetical protein